MIEAEEKVSEEETQPHQEEIPKENGEKEKLDERETEGKGKEKEKEKEKEKGKERDKRNAMTLRPTSRTKDYGEKEVVTESRRSGNIFAANDVIDRVMYLALEVEKAMAGLERKADFYGIQLNDLEVLVAVMNNVLVVLEGEEDVTKGALELSSC